MRRGLVILAILAFLSFMFHTLRTPDQSLERLPSTTAPFSSDELRKLTESVGHLLSSPASRPTTDPSTQPLSEQDRSALDAGSPPNGDRSHDTIQSWSKFQYVWQPLAAAGIEHWRLSRWVADCGVPASAMGPARAALRRLEDFLRSVELEVRSLDGMAYDPGLAARVVDTVDEPSGAGQIVKTLSPMVLWRGTVIREADIVVSQRPVRMTPSFRKPLMSSIDYGIDDLGTTNSRHRPVQS